MSTIKDVAFKAGVGVSTVSRYLQKKGYVSEEAKNKIEKAIKELDYYPNAMAQSIRSQKSKTIALIIPSISNQFFPQLATHIEQCLFKKDYKMILCNTNGSAEREDKYIDVILQNRIDGVISSTGEIPKRLMDQKIPIVSIDRLNTNSNGSVFSVTANHYLGGEQAANHLIDNGCRRLLCLHGPLDVEPAVLRRRGFVETAIKRNAHAECIHFESDYDVKGVNERYDGVFTWNDLTAITFVAKCLEKQIDIPNELQVVGFDDIELLQYYYPKITTIQQPMNQLAQKAVGVLMNRINTDDELNTSIVLDTKLVVRDTTKEK